MRWLAREPSLNINFFLKYLEISLNLCYNRVKFHKREKMRILIVEDEVTLNKTIAEGLQEFGYQTDSSENFKDAEYYIGCCLTATAWI